MNKVLIIGCGGVGTVAAYKCAQYPEVFHEIVIASRRKEKCDEVAKAIGAPNITTDQVDADDVQQLVALLKKHQPQLVVNLALPYQDLTIMDACLECGVNYLDTANYEPRDEAHFEYSWQWAYRERFEKAGLCAILGCGFDPGVSGIYTAYAAKHHFKEMHTLDIVDCNAGTTARHLPPTSTLKPTFAKSPKRAATTKAASGFRPVRSKCTSLSLTPKSVLAKVT